VPHFTAVLPPPRSACGCCYRRCLSLGAAHALLPWDLLPLRNMAREPALPHLASPPQYNIWTYLMRHMGCRCRRTAYLLTYDFPFSPLAPGAGRARLLYLCLQVPAVTTSRMLPPRVCLPGFAACLRLRRACCTHTAHRACRRWVPATPAALLPPPPPAVAAVRAGCLRNTGPAAALGCWDTLFYTPRFIANNAVLVATPACCASRRCYSAPARRCWTCACAAAFSRRCA